MIQFTIVLALVIIFTVYFTIDFIRTVKRANQEARDEYIE